MRKIIRKLAGSCLSAGDEKLMKSIDSADVVSFDMFDTLIKRNIKNPEDVHNLVQAVYRHRTGICIEDYKSRRCQAQRRAREGLHKEEITLTEIFDHVKGITKVQCQELLKLEEETELKICQYSRRMRKIFRYCMKKGKTVIVISDMYLSKQVLEQILLENGFFGYTRLFVSSEYGKTKHRGGLFQIAASHMNTEPSRILHIGDSIKSDYLMPRKMGFQAELIHRDFVNLGYFRQGLLKREADKNGYSYHMLSSFISNNLHDDYSEAENIGYEVLGPLLAGYLEWLDLELERDGVDKIFFLAREGKLLLDAYEILFPGRKRKASYFYVSRKSVITPLLNKIHEYEEFAYRVSMVFLRAECVEDFSIVCGMNREEFQEKLLPYGLNGRTSLAEITDKDILLKIITDIGKDYMEKQDKYLRRYCCQEGFTGKSAIADIGWCGTMQDALQELFHGKEDTEIYGYYIGVRNNKKDRDYSHLKRKGYLFCPEYKNDMGIMVRFSNNLCETLFLNPSGSTAGYEEADGKIFPVFNDCEFSGSDVLLMKSMQKAALQFVTDYAQNGFLKQYLDFYPEAAFAGYEQLALHPTGKTVKLFSEIQFLYGRKIPLTAEKSLFYYMTHPKKLKKDFSENGCKVLFLKSLWKLPFPYYKVLKWMTVRMNIRNKY